MTAMAGAGKDQIEKLRSIPLFAELSDGALERILECAADFDAAPGHVLVESNQPGAGLFVIEDGTVEVELQRRKIQLGPGEFFGELALLDEGATHVARVHAVSRVRCLAIRRDDFDRLLEAEPRFAISMLKVLARRLAAAARVTQSP
jgi:CRP-like cAMP-binding protein